MKKFIFLLAACLVITACGRDLTPEQEAVEAAKEKVGLIQELIEAEDWDGFITHALSPEDKGAAQQTGPLSEFAAKLAKTDMSQVKAIVDGMAAAEPYFYHAEGNEQVAFPLDPAVGATETMTMISDDGEWYLYQSRKNPAE